MESPMVNKRGTQNINQRTTRSIFAANRPISCFTRHISGRTPSKETGHFKRAKLSSETRGAVIQDESITRKDPNGPQPLVSSFSSPDKRDSCCLGGSEPIHPGHNRWNLFYEIDMLIETKDIDRLAYSGIAFNAVKCSECDRTDEENDMVICDNHLAFPDKPCENARHTRCSEEMEDGKIPKGLWFCGEECRAIDEQHTLENPYARLQFDKMDAERYAHAVAAFEETSE